MTYNERLARWQGIDRWIEYGTPDYLNNDAAAMGLLDTLVGKGFKPMLTYCAPLWHFHYNWVYGQDGRDNGMPSCFVGKTRHEAVCAAVLELIERETLSGKEGV